MALGGGGRWVTHSWHGRNPLYVFHMCKFSHFERVSVRHKIVASQYLYSGANRVSLKTSTSGRLPNTSRIKMCYLVGCVAGVPQRVTHHLPGARVRVHRLELDARLGHCSERRGLPVRLGSLLPHHHVEV